MAQGKAKDPKPTKKQLAYVEALMENGFNKLAAAKAAGYSGLPDNLTNIHNARAVQNELRKRYAEARGHVPATMEYVTNSLVEVVERALSQDVVRDMRGKPVIQEVEGITDEEGNPIPFAVVHTSDLKAATGSLKLLGQYLGMWDRKQDGDSAARTLIEWIEQQTGGKIEAEAAPIASERAIEDADYVDVTPEEQGDAA